MLFFMRKHGYRRRRRRGPGAQTMGRGLRHEGGFTLPELLTALAVLAMASTIGISMYTSSADIADIRRTRIIGMSLAQEQLTRLTNQPELFQWPTLDGAPGSMEEIVPRDDGGHKFQAPSVSTTTRRANMASANFYDQFSWQAYATLPSANAHYADVCVIVRRANTRGDRVALTSAISLRDLEGL